MRDAAGVLIETDQMTGVIDTGYLGVAGARDAGVDRGEGWRRQRHRQYGCHRNRGHLDVDRGRNGCHAPICRGNDEVEGLNFAIAGEGEACELSLRESYASVDDLRNVVGSIGQGDA